MIRDNLIPLPKMSEYLLEDFMRPMNLDTQDLSRYTGISTGELKEILNDELEITPEISKKLAAFFGVSQMLFYKIQQDIKARENVRELKYA